MSNPQLEECEEYPARWNLMILLRAIAGGGVDAVMIVGFNVLTGAQSGNTILLGAAIAQGRLAMALSSTVSVVAYVIGAAVGQLIIARHRDTWPWPSAVVTNQLVLLGCLLLFWRLAGPHPGQEAGICSDCFLDPHCARSEKLSSGRHAGAASQRLS